MSRLNKFIKVCLAAALVLLIVFLCSKVEFLFTPIRSLTKVILIPLLLSGFLYYMLRPLVDYMERHKIKRIISILLIYLVLAILITGFILGVWPALSTQITNLLLSAPDYLNKFSHQLTELEQTGILSNFIPEDFSLLSNMSEYLNKGFSLLSNYVSGLFSFFSNFAIILFTTPLLLFYMLKEGNKFSGGIARFFPRHYYKDVKEVTAEIDSALSGYIISRVLVNVALGILMYIGFLFLGLPYALLLTVIAVILNFIPFFGAILSSIPIVIIGWIESPSMAIWSLIIILVAQQIQDNLISPLIFGKKLDIHPITTIILVLAGGDLFGIIGMLIIIPVYMFFKIIIVKIYNLFFKSQWEAEDDPEAEQPGDAADEPDQTEEPSVETTEAE
ncbi:MULTISPECIES: AI-2E family transporter [unclassified Paenibacillus]|uniref:AI-2E family transporter n=1 Tax=unclassified Paenibacillus TaxID=185978 RepID=UPI000840F979|nr:AI-2E family transporter [Paenibacillus sp. GM2]NWL89776.1 AI-2E family transporter [Paenibacillus sp. 79R4]